MKLFAIRSMLLLGLVSSLVLRHGAIRERRELLQNYDMTQMITELLRDSRVILHENPVPPPRVLSCVVYFQRPENDLPSIAMPFSLTKDANRMLRRLNKSGYVSRYYYFDESWPRQQRATLFLRWMKQSAISALGASDYLPVEQVILVADPPNRLGPDPIDWQRAWRKDAFVAKARDGFEYK